MKRSSPSQRSSARPTGAARQTPAATGKRAPAKSTERPERVAAKGVGAIKSTGGASPTTADVDRQLIELLAQRVALVRSEFEDAQQRGASVELWQLHEQAAQQAASHATQLGLDAARATEWIKHGVSLCIEQAHVTEPIAYLGPIYSYSYLAAVKHFGLAAPLVPVATIAAVFDELLRGQAHYGVVPIENSTDGRVVDTLGMFARLPIKICGEVLLPIHHCLLGRGPRAEIVEIYSKPQAMSQCRGWLSTHVPDARLIEISSTAAAARLAAEKKGAAAVASREAGIHHGLEIIDENIEDSAHNVTRFVIIGNKESSPTGHDKTSLMFQLRHQPGALAEAMVAFQKAKLNLTWIESFPMVDHPREYLFFVELEGHISSKQVGAALQDLRKQTLRLEVLGSYPKASSI